MTIVGRIACHVGKVCSRCNGCGNWGDRGGASVSARCLMASLETTALGTTAL